MHQFDHVVIAVQDLDRAITSYRRLGFTVLPGGQHEGRGTHNAIVPFGLGYLELLAVRDEAEALSAGEDRRVLVEFLREEGGGLLGYSVATNDIEADAARLRQAGLDAVGPFRMERRMSNGRLLAWRLLEPGGYSWRRPWPFFIQWDRDDRGSTMVEHLNGVGGVRRIRVKVRDLEDGIDLYERRLGLVDEQGRTGVPMDVLNPQPWRFFVGSLAIELTGLVPGTLASPSNEEGIVEIGLATPDLPGAQDVLSSKAVAFASSTGVREAIEIAPEYAEGAHLILERVNE